MALLLTSLLIFLVVYVYLGYPLVLYLLSKSFGSATERNDSYRPRVTLIVSCFNEEDVVEAKIENCLALEYPEDLLDFIFVSDGSTDRTDELIEASASPRIKLIRQEGRLGKTSGLNLAVPRAEGEIVVFSDANAMYAPDAIGKLVRNFVDDRVGYVVGAAIYTDGDRSAAAKSEDSYWQYELKIKHLESRLHSVVGGDGAIYAIRKDLYRPLDAEDINDFVNPLQIVAAGYRGVFDPEAQCFEQTAGEFNKEAKRKERIVNRSFRGLMKVKTVMNPGKSGFFAFEVISHKLLRWLVPVFLAGIALGSIQLAYSGSLLFKLIYLLEVVFVWLAIIGYLKRTQSNLSAAFFYPYYFLMVNFYSLIGVTKALAGNIQVTWESPRAAKQSAGGGFRGRAVVVLFGIVAIVVLIDVLA